MKTFRARPFGALGAALCLAGFALLPVASLSAQPDIRSFGTAIEASYLCQVFSSMLTLRMISREAAVLDLCVVYKKDSVLPSIAVSTPKSGPWFILGKGQVSSGSAYRSDIFSSVFAGRRQNAARISQVSVSAPWIFAGGAGGFTAFGKVSPLPDIVNAELGAEQVLQYGAFSAAAALSVSAIPGIASGSGWKPKTLARIPDTMPWLGISAQYRSYLLEVGLLSAMSWPLAGQPGFAAALCAKLGDSLDIHSAPPLTWELAAALHFADPSFLNPGGEKPSLFLKTTASISLRWGIFTMDADFLASWNADKSPFSAAQLTDDRARPSFGAGWPDMRKAVDTMRFSLALGMEYLSLERPGIFKRAREGSLSCGISAQCSIEKLASVTWAGQIIFSYTFISTFLDRIQADLRLGATDETELGPLRIRLSLRAKQWGECWIGLCVPEPDALPDFDPEAEAESGSEKPLRLLAGLKIDAALGAGFSLSGSVSAPAAGWPLDSSTAWALPDMSLQLSWSM